MRRREHETLEVPISTLIDVVFLLIIFFIVTATVQRDMLDERVKLAQSPHIEVDKVESARLTISIRRAEDGGMIYAINGAHHSLAGLESRIRRAFRQHPRDLKLILRADKNLPYREVDKVGRLAAGIGCAFLYHTGDPGEQ